VCHARSAWRARSTRSSFSPPESSARAASSFSSQGDPLRLAARRQSLLTKRLGVLRQTATYADFDPLSDGDRNSERDRRSGRKRRGPRNRSRARPSDARRSRKHCADLVADFRGLPRLDPRSA
jgi:hypothetical protein